MTSTLSVLYVDTAAGRSASKVWRRGADGSPTCQGFNSGHRFVAQVVPVSNIREVATWLDYVALRSDAFVTRWIPRSEIDLTRPHRRLARPRAQDKIERGPVQATYIENPYGQAHIELDVDDLDLPFAGNLVDDPEAVIRYVVSVLPPCFQGVTCWWSLTSSAGMRGDPRAVSAARVRLVFWLDRPLTDEMATFWVQSFDVRIDSALYHPVQEIYFASPRFEGLVDPLPRRFGLLVGSSEVVTVPQIEKPVSRLTSHGGPRGTPRHYETIMSQELGDGPGRTGFHDAILRAIFAYAASRRSDWSFLKDDVRRRVGNAPRKANRDEGVIDDYLAEESLEHMIEGALARIDEPDQVTRDQLLATAKSWKSTRKNSPLGDELRSLGPELEHISKGTVFDESKILRLASRLAAVFPLVSSKSVSDHVAQSLQLMPGSMPPEQFKSEFASIQASVRDANIAKEIAVATRASQRVKDAFGGLREHPYTEKEIDIYAREASCSREAFRHRWLLQNGASYYVFFDGSYRGPLTTKDVLAATTTFLSPAQTAGVSLEKLSKEGITRKTIDDLLEDYGIHAVEVIGDFTAQKTTYVAESHRVIEAIRPLRELTPEFDARVDTWLRFLGGPKAEKLLDWIACVTDLTTPAPALFLTGETGAGKSLLADGLARLWSILGPTPAESMFEETFNSAITSCPLVFADEKLPKGRDDRPATEKLRQVIAASNHPLKRKGIPEIKIMGAIRMIIATNPDKLFLSAGALGDADIAAIAERFLHVPIESEGSEAAKYLRESGGRSFAKWMIDHDRIARHALWLRGTRKITKAGRWAVPGDCLELLTRMRASTGYRWPICHLIVGWLRQANHVPLSVFSGKKLPDPVRRSGGRIYVFAESLRELWIRERPAERVPAIEHFVSSVNELCVRGSRRKLGPNGAREHYKELRLDSLFAWWHTLDEPEEELRDLVFAPPPAPTAIEQSRRDVTTAVSDAEEAEIGAVEAEAEARRTNNPQAWGRAKTARDEAGAAAQRVTQLRSSHGLAS